MNIGVIARQTGIEVATLRKWETRYGFPKPQRTASGHREYTEETLEQLLNIRREMAKGQRAGKVLRDFLARTAQHSQEPVAPKHAEGISRLLSSDTTGLRQWFLQYRNDLTAADFVELIAAPMAREVGYLWARGALPVFTEHFFSEELLSVLSTRPEPQPSLSALPRVLLTAPAGEKHNLGLRMAGAVLASVGKQAIYLPCDLPNNQIVAAAIHYRVAAVGLTASLSSPPKLLSSSFREIRRTLPETIQLWVGGAGTDLLPKLPEHTTQVRDMYVLLQLAQQMPVLDETMQGERGA